MLLVNQASHRQCSRKKHRLIDTVTTCHSKPPKKKTSNFKDRALALRRQFRQGGQVAKHLIHPWIHRSSTCQLATCQMFCRVPRPCYLRAALAQRIVNSPRYGFQRSLVFASGFVCFVSFLGSSVQTATLGISVMVGRDAGAPRKSIVYELIYPISVYNKY